MMNQKIVENCEQYRTHKRARDRAQTDTQSDTHIGIEKMHVDFEPIVNW